MGTQFDLQGLEGNLLVLKGWEGILLVLQGWEGNLVQLLQKEDRAPSYMQVGVYQPDLADRVLQQEGRENCHAA